MSFELQNVHGTVAELESDLSAPPQHEREEAVTPVIKKAIAYIVESLGGYLSVSANGNINPVAGETGDVVHIYITSLPQPDSAPVETPIATAPGIETGETPQITEESAPTAAPVQQEIAPVVTEEQSQPQPIVPPENQEIATEPLPPVIQENSSESPSAISLSEPISIDPPAVSPEPEN